MACKGKNQAFLWAEQTTEYKQCFEVCNRQCKQRDKQERGLPYYVNWHDYANLSQVIPAEDLFLFSYHFEDCFGLFHQAHVYCVHLNEQTWPQAWKLSSESLFQQHDNLSKETFLIKVKYEVKGNCWWLMLVKKQRKRRILKATFLVKSSSWFSILETVYILIPHQHKIKRSTWIERRWCTLHLYSRSFERWQPMKMLKLTAEFPGIRL